MNKVLWLDVDGVLLDWLTPFLEYTGLYKEGVRANQITDYDMSKLFPSREEFYKAMEGFSMSRKFRELPLTADKRLLIALKNAGYDLKIITKIPYCAEVAINRMINLAEFGAIFSEVVFVPVEQNKFMHLQSRIIHMNSCMLDVTHTVIEDAPDFLDVANKHKHLCKTYGIIHEYNKHIIPRMDNVWMYSHFNTVARQLLTETYGG